MSEAIQKRTKTLDVLTNSIFLRAITVVISVIIGAIYTNTKNEKLNIKYEDSVTKIEKLITQNSVLRNEIASLKSSLLILSLIEDDSPKPRWIKSKDSRMLALNKAFERIYLKPNGLTMSDYVGHFDKDVWPEDIAKNFVKGDSLIMALRRPHTFYEEIRMNNQLKGEIFRVTKWPVIINGTIVAVKGEVDLEFKEN